MAAYIQNRPQQFFQTALNNFANLPGQIWNATAFWRSIAAAVVDSTLKVVTVASNPISLATFVVGRVLEEDPQYHATGDFLENAAMAIAMLPTGGLAEGAAALDAELGDGLVGAESTAESAATDDAIEQGVINEGEAEMANPALEEAENLTENTTQAISKCVGGNCFVAGTEVITGYDASTGVFSQTPIQDIQVGDEVLTRNQYDPNGPLQEQVVTATEQHTAYDLREVTIEDGDGSTETIQATDEHPFYVEGQGFTGAAQLSVGEQIETADGSIATIVGNVDEPEPDGVTVYNFTVGTDHTYFVDQSGTAVWVHNTCADARALRNNLIDNLEFPAPGDRAAHIVPTGAFSNRSAEVQGFIEYSQQVLEGAGIGLNDAENGFFTSSANHLGTHTDEYFEGLAGRLAETDGSTEEVLAALQQLKNELTGVP